MRYHDTMTTLPLILLDVDGVLSPLGNAEVFPEAALKAWDRTELVQAASPGAFGMWFAQPVIDFLKEVSLRGRAEVRWHTSWQEMAGQIFGPEFDLPPWPVHDAREARLASSATGWWKFESIRPVLAEERPVLWLDDDILDAIEVGDVPAQAFSNGKLVAVAPEVKVGLTPNDLELIDKTLTDWGF